MAKYGAAAAKRVKSAVHREKRGTLKSGSGRKVTSPKQAIAIGLSEARAKGGKVPSPKTAGAKKTGARKTTRKTAGTAARKTSRRTSGSKKR